MSQFPRRFRQAMSWKRHEVDHSLSYLNASRFEDPRERYFARRMAAHLWSFVAVGVGCMCAHLLPAWVSTWVSVVGSQSSCSFTYWSFAPFGCVGKRWLSASL